MEMPFTNSLGLAAALAGLALGCASASACAAPPATATVSLSPASGSEVRGEVTLRATEGGLLFGGKLTGLAPGLHGFHVHDVGDCSAPDASSAKGHYNPTGKPHGTHAGDLPDLIADAAGTALPVFLASDLHLGDGAGGISGRALVVHADPDDHVSQPAGNSGKRISCGVVPASP
jgi:Cu-Zn family superoxide dismutase